MDKFKRRAAVIAVTISVICLMFTVDALRARVFVQPPIFCVPTDVLSDGVSRDYYGLGYKIWKDTDPFDGSTEYRVSLWILPKAVNIRIRKG